MITNIIYVSTHRSIKKILFNVSLLLFSLLSSSQIVKRTIIKNDSNEPAAYATVKVLNKKIGTIASAEGEFELDIDEKDSIIITYVGYETIILKANTMEHKIYIKPINKFLEEVIVTNHKIRNVLTLGNGRNLLKMNIKCKFNSIKRNTCYPWGPSGNKEEFAEKIELPFSRFHYRIKKIYIPGSRWECNGRMFLRIIVEDSTGNPGKEIYFKPFDVKQQKVDKGKLQLDLSSENITIKNLRSFFISVGWLDGNEKQNCNNTILLQKMSEGKSYSRSLFHVSYSWIPFGQILSGNGEIHEIRTIYAVEVEEIE